MLRHLRMAHNPRARAMGEIPQQICEAERVPLGGVMDDYKECLNSKAYYSVGSWWRHYDKMHCNRVLAAEMRITV
jgi:hypothetical protein